LGFATRGESSANQYTSVQIFRVPAFRGCSMIQSQRAARFGWFVLGYVVLVILWGAFVRASSSGDGCGSHWPLCDGSLLPSFEGSTKKIVEFSHRVSSGLVFPLVVALGIIVLRQFGKGSAARKAALGSLFFTITEGAVGALLVVFELVAENASIGRGVWMSVHLINTFLLLACLTTTVVFLSGRTLQTFGERISGSIQLRGQGSTVWALGAAIVGMLLLGASGAVAALGDTLFPSTSLKDALYQDFSPTAHVLIRLRMWHPMIAISVGLFLIFATGLVAHLRPAPRVRKLANFIIGVYFAQLALGLLNVVLLAPIWMQIVHLFVADVLWIALISLCLFALDPAAPRRVLETDADHAAVEVAPVKPGVAAFKAYIALTKPRVISLLLFTTLAAMFVAKQGWPGFWLLIAVAIGGYMAAGAANTINMIIDRDIDRRMHRTATRPTVTQQIPTPHATIFAIVLAVGSFAILWSAANLLSALLAMAGLAFYVVVYTLILKRRTWHNIVIGGAAGCFPPLRPGASHPWSDTRRSATR